LCIWPGGVTLKAQVDHACVGLVAGDPRRRRGYVNIVTLAVDPGWRRCGIGEQLLRACEAQFDLPRFELQVRQHNTAAIQLYRKLGYAIVGELPRYYGDADGYLMAKERR